MSLLSLLGAAPLDRAASRPARRWGSPLAALAGLALSACAQLPGSGPTRDEIRQAEDVPGTGAVQIVDVDARVATTLKTEHRAKPFSQVLARARDTSAIGRGDVVEISLWEAPPATLFGGGSIDPTLPSVVHATTLPEQTVDRDGFVSVPFAGRIQADARTPRQIEEEIVERLRAKAHQPEAMVRVVRNNSATVTVVGEVVNNLRMPLTARGERLLDALAAAGGARQPVNKTTIQVTRGDRVAAMPLEQIIRDPEDNIRLQPSDVVTAMSQPLTFTALGATGKNDEIPFEAQGITLAQALARAGGLVDARADAQGVFIFRFEQKDALDWPRQPVATPPDGRVPVVYRMNLKDPVSFFVMQNFAINDKDVVYVSNAPAAEFQKFLNLVVTLVYPFDTVYQVVH